MPEMPTLPRSRPLTRADLDALRDAVDDGHRYELIDGVLLVSPSPRHLHQRGVGNLHLTLRAACPDDLEVLLAPFDVALADDTVMQPDLIVARRAEVTERDLPVSPVLAIEVLSPSTRSFDLHTKKDRLRRAGCPHCWVVDPGRASGLGGEPAVTAWRLVGEGESAGYVLAGSAEGAEELTLDAPLAVRLRPVDLVAH